MTTYGNKQEPGIVTDLTSSAAVNTATEAPSDVGIVGQADLANAETPADTSKVYQITRASKAVEFFGPRDSSLLTEAVIDALTEGAFPVYAVATPSTTVSGEDQSGVSTTTVSLNNAPIRESASSITVTLDGTSLTVNIVYDDVSNYSPASDECYVNPVRGNVEIPSTPSSSLKFGYDHFDYAGGLDVIENNAADVIDFLVALSENGAVADDVVATVATMEREYNLALALVGAGITIDPTTFSQSYDDSRTQSIYPTRFADGSSALGAFAGFRASLSLQTTPINQRLATNKPLRVSLSQTQRADLIDARVVPLSSEAGGVRVVDDPTTVSDKNTNEQNIQYGFNRLVADQIIETTRENQRPFIGRLNSQNVRNTLEGMVDDSLTELQQSNVVISYTVNILKENAVTVGLEMSVDLVEPLRFIENTVTITQGQ